MNPCTSQPVPVPPKVFHPNLGLVGMLVTEISNESSSMYDFMKNGKFISRLECFCW